MDKHLLLFLDNNTSLKGFLDKTLEKTKYKINILSDFKDVLNEIKLSKNLYNYSKLHKYVGIIINVKKENITQIKEIKAIEPYIPIIVISNISSKDFLIKLLLEKIFCFYKETIIETEFLETIKLISEFYNVKDNLEIISASPNLIELTVPAELIYVNRIDSFLKNIIIEFSEKEKNKIIFAFRELIQNAIEHGSNFCTDKKITIKYIHAKKFIFLSIKDQGKGFKFEAIQHATIGGVNSPAEVIKYRKKIGMRPGGLGISSVLNISDELIYNDKGNEVIMIKYFNE